MANENWIADLLGYREIRKDGVALVSRAVLDFLGSGITVADDPVTRSTKITVSVGGGGNSIVEIKKVCRVATTANVTLSGLQVIDAVSLNESDRVLVKNQTVTSQNGIYVAHNLAWVRADDFDASAEIGSGTLFLVDLGTVNSDSLWMLTAPAPVTLGSSSLSFKRVDSGDASAIRGAIVQNVAAQAGDALLYSSPTQAAPGRIRDANIASDAAIALSKIASGANGQVAKVVGNVWSASSLSPSDFGENIIVATPVDEQSNWDPAGWSGASIVRLQPSTNRRVYGLKAVTAGAIRKVLRNEGTANIFLGGVAPAHPVQDAGNTMQLLGGSWWYTLAPSQSVGIFYDALAGAWKAISDEHGAIRATSGLRVCEGADEVRYWDSTGATLKPRARVSNIPLCDSYCAHSAVSSAPQMDYWSRNTSYGRQWVYYAGAPEAQALVWQIRLPWGAQLSSLLMRVQCYVGVNVVLGSDSTSLYNLTYGVNASGQDVLITPSTPISPGPYEHFALAVTPLSNAGSGILVYCVPPTINWLDPGPRNY